MTKSKVLIVEDNTIVALDLKGMVEKLGLEVSGVFCRSEDVIKSCIENTPDIILMDINLGENENGIDIVKQIQKIKNIPTIYLTAYSDDLTMEKAFQTDPIAYIQKPFSQKDINSTIKLALFKIKKDKNIKESAHKYIGYGYYFDIVRHELYYKNKKINLTPKEKRVFKLLVSHINSPISQQKLEEFVWLNSVPSSSSLRTLIYRLKEKLDCDIIKSSYSNGYMIKVD